MNAFSIVNHHLRTLYHTADERHVSLAVNAFCAGDERIYAFCAGEERILHYKPTCWEYAFELQPTHTQPATKQK